MADEIKSNMKRGADDELAVGSERIRRSRKAAKLDEAIEFSAAEEPRPNDEPEPPLDTVEARAHARRRKSPNDYYEEVVIEEEKAKKRKDDLHSKSIDARGMSKELRGRLRRIADILKLLMIFACIAGAIYGLIALYNLFHVKAVTITGSINYSERQLLSMSGIQNGDLIFRYTEASVKEKLDRIGNVRLLSVKRDYPNTVIIEVVDCDARAAIAAANGTYSLITADGLVLATGVETCENLILIKGLSAKSYGVGSYIDSDSMSGTEVAAVRLMQEINKSSIAFDVTAIDLSNITCVKLEIGELFTINLGNTAESADNVETAAKAYQLFLPDYPLGGIINVFTGSTVVDFTPNKVQNGD